MSARQPLSAGSSHLTVTPNHGLGSLSRRSSMSSNQGDKDSGSGRTKVTKSRNGCTTCKAKRLKCDETKPTCLQCKKRGVDCGGYKKSFKWKSFDESSFSGEGSSRARDTTHQGDDNDQLPISPTVTRSPKFASSTHLRSSQTFPNAAGSSGVPTTILDVPVPQRQCQGSQSSQSPYHGQPAGLEHLQVPGFPEIPGQIPLSRQTLPQTYTLGAQNPNPALDAAALEAMIVQDINSPLTPIAYFTGFQTPSHAAMQYHQPDLADLPTTQAQYGQQIDMAQNSFGVTGQWHAEQTGQQIDFDDPTVQQAMTEMFRAGQGIMGQGFDANLQTTRSFGG